jgi:hypothetical protein
MKFNIADDTQFSQRGAMMRKVDQMLPFVSMEPNSIIEDTAGMQLNKVYQHSFQIKKHYSLFWITRMDGITPPMLSSVLYDVPLNWEEDCVLKRILLIAGAQTHSLAIDMTIDPQAKQSQC